MKKLNIILAVTAATLLLLSVYLNRQNSGTTQNELTASVAPAIQKKVVQKKATEETLKKNSLQKETEQSSFFKVDTKKAVTASRKEVKEYSGDESSDEEVYDNETVVISVEKHYSNFFAKTKNSIVSISNGNSTFYGVVTRSKKGIYVVTDRSSATENPKVTIKTLSGEKLKIDTVTSCDKLVSFKLKAPFPNKLKPVDTVESLKRKKSLALGAFSFDYGDEPEMTIGKGIMRKNGECEISSKLRRCRPGTPLFTAKGTLFGVTTWNPSGNIGVALESQQNQWSPIKYPFKVVTKKSKKYSSYNGSRYK